METIIEIFLGAETGLFNALIGAFLYGLPACISLYVLSYLFLPVNVLKKHFYRGYN